MDISERDPKEIEAEAIAAGVTVLSVLFFAALGFLFTVVGIIWICVLLFKAVFL